MRLLTLEKGLKKAQGTQNRKEFIDNLEDSIRQWYADKNITEPSDIRKSLNCYYNGTKTPSKLMQQALSEVIFKDKTAYNQLLVSSPHHACEIAVKVVRGVIAPKKLERKKSDYLTITFIKKIAKTQNTNDSKVIKQRTEKFFKKTLLNQKYTSQHKEKIINLYKSELQNAGNNQNLKQSILLEILTNFTN